MRVALDSFEVEGIGHNLPFVAAVMDHEIFIKGDMTTAFIEEQYPEGFEGVTLGEEMPCAGSRRAVPRCTGWPRSAAPACRAGWTTTNAASVHDWVVSLQGEQFAVSVAADKEGANVTFEDGHSVRGDERLDPGRPIGRLSVDGSPR